jgi:DNA polymerase-3 subunit epsilon
MDMDPSQRKRKPPAPLPPLDRPFVAIDFETADHAADSACAVGLVRVEGSKIVARETVLIRPPRSRIIFTYVHGITWPMVKDAPIFKDAWTKLAPLLDGATFLAAHNAPFDRGVLGACCVAHGLAAPALPFVCTVQLARRTWALKPANLPAVCRRLGIGLIHHDAGSDAEACARIVIAAAARPALPVEQQLTLPGTDE